MRVPELPNAISAREQPSVNAGFVHQMTVVGDIKGLLRGGQRRWDLSDGSGEPGCRFSLYGGPLEQWRSQFEAWQAARGAGDFWEMVREAD